MHRKTCTTTYTHTHVSTYTRAHTYTQTIVRHFLFLYFNIFEVDYYAAIFVRDMDKSLSQCMPPVRSFSPALLPTSSLLFRIPFLYTVFPVFASLHVVYHSEVHCTYLQLFLTHQQSVILLL